MSALLGMRLDGKLFALPVTQVRDVMHPQPLTPIPLAPEAVLGAMNLRGTAVTVLDLRRCLGLPAGSGKGMQLVVESGGAAYGIVVDAVEDILPPAGEGAPVTPLDIDSLLGGLRAA